MVSEILIEDEQIKIITKTQPSKRKGERPAVRLYPDTHRKLSKLSEETHLSITRLASVALEFAFERLTIVEQDEDEWA